jgi:hypothetical protein
MRSFTLWNGKRPTASCTIVAVFILWLWVMAVLPALAFFNVAWGEKSYDLTCPAEPMFVHYCPGECPEDFGRTWDEVCAY